MRAANGLENSRSTLMTGMPASIALMRDLGQRGAVDGQQHDGVDLVVDEGLDLADLQVDVVGALGDDAGRRREYFAASAMAAELMAPIQPWSAAGAEKPMTTFSPGASLPPAAAARWPRRRPVSLGRRGRWTCSRRRARSAATVPATQRADLRRDG